MNNKYFILLLLLVSSFHKSQAQKKVTIYRSGVAVSPTYSTIDSTLQAALSGDSLVLSAHTFYEKSLQGGTKNLIFQGTQTTTDSTIIDPNHIGFFYNASAVTRFKDIIFQNGKGGIRIGAAVPGTDSIRLSGNTIIRNSTSENDSFPLILFNRAILVIENNTKIHDNNVGGPLIAGAQNYFVMQGKSSIYDNHTKGYLGTGSSWDNSNGLLNSGGGFHLKDSCSILNNSSDTGKTAGLYISRWTGIALSGIKVFIDDGVTISGNKVLTSGYGYGGAIFVDNLYGRTVDPEINLRAATFSNNEAAYGGAIYVRDSQTKIITNGTIFDGNKARNGGAIYSRGQVNIKNANFINNQADTGTAIYLNTLVANSKTSFLNISSNRFFDRDASGKRPNEIFATYAPATFLPPSIIVKENWWGKNDTINSFRESPRGLVAFVNFAKTNWSIKDGLPIVKGDTNFTIGSLMKPNTIGVFPKNSLPMLRGYYFVDTGNVIPNTSTTDSNNFVGTIYHTFEDSSFKSATCNVLAYIDEDTFRATILVWSKDTTTNDTTTNITDLPALKTFVYPNPFAENLHIEGLNGKNNIVIYDALGKAVFKEETKESSVDVSLSHLPKGIYLFSIHSDDGRIGQSKIWKE